MGMIREESIVMQKAIRDNLHETEKDYPYRDDMIPLMKESCNMAIQVLEQEPKTDRVEYGTDGNAYRLTISNGKELEQESCEDAISREKVKQFLYERIDRLNDNELYDIFSRIIDDMYNELPSVTPQPFINKPCVSSGVCEHDKQKVLEKIRAEIAKIGRTWGTKKALEIIDKYKSESESEE